MLGKRRRPPWKPWCKRAGASETAIQPGTDLRPQIKAERGKEGKATYKRTRPTTYIIITKWRDTAGDKAATPNTPGNNVFPSRVLCMCARGHEYDQHSTDVRSQDLELVDVLHEEQRNLGLHNSAQQHEHLEAIDRPRPSVLSYPIEPMQCCAQERKGE